MWNCWQELNFRVTEYIPLLARVPKVSRWRLEKCRYRDHNIFHFFIVEEIFDIVKHLFNMARILLKADWFTSTFTIIIHVQPFCAKHIEHEVLFIFSDVETKSMRTVNIGIPWLCQIKFKLVHEHSRTVYLLDIQGSVVHV